MSRLLCSVSCFALLAAVASLSLPGSALAASFNVTTVPPDANSTTAKAVTGTDTGTVQSGATLATSANSIVWSGAGSNVTIVNSGTITSSANRGFDTSGSLLNSSLTFTNNAGATISASNDALRINGSIGNGRVIINNYGTMTSTNNGRAIQLDANSSTTGSVTINNFAGGLLQSLGDADALRPGMNGVVNNWGTINAAAGGGDGVDFQDRTATVNNKAGGVITAAKHGINAGNGVINANNDAGGTILGRNGSGIGSDNNSATNAATVVNWGRITGAYNGSGTGDGDGVDIDGAATITNNLGGIIEGTGAGGYDSGGRLNNAEGISIGGGTIVNAGTITGASFAIVTNNDSVASRSGVAATTLTNSGTIIGQNGFAVRFENKLGTAADNDTIVNTGTIIGNGTIPNPAGVVTVQNGGIDTNSTGTLNGVTYTGTGNARFIRGDGSAIQMGEGADTLTNSGTIIGNTGRAVNMEGGNDSVRVNAGSKIVGLVDGGVGTDNLNYQKVGLSAAKAAALQAGQTVNIGGTLYTSFETFTGSTLQSFSSFANGATAGVASVFDNMSTTQAASAETQSLIDRVASASDVSGALAQLTPTAFQALTNIGINNSAQTGQVADQRLSSLRGGGSAMSFAGLGTLAMLETMQQGPSRVPFAPVASDAGAEAALAYASGGRDRVNDAFAAVEPSRGFNKAPRQVIGDTPWGVFVSGSAVFGRQDATATAPQSKFTSAGVTVGVDRRINDNLILGVLGGYTRTNADLDTLGSTSKIDTWLIGAYGTYYGPSWFANAAVIYGRNSYDNNRIALGTSNTSSPNGNQFGVQGSLGTDYRYNRWVVTPEVGLQYTTVGIDGYTEAGGAALAIQSDRANSLRSSVGARLRTDVVMATGTITPELRASWQHEFLDKARDIRASFVDQSLPGAFATTAAGSGTDFGIVGAGVSMSLAVRTQLSLGYDFKFGGRDFTAHQIGGRVRHTF